METHSSRVHDIFENMEKGTAIKIIEAMSGYNGKGIFHSYYNHKGGKGIIIAYKNNGILYVGELVFSYIEKGYDKDTENMKNIHVSSPGGGIVTLKYNRPYKYFDKDIERIRDGKIGDSVDKKCLELLDQNNL